VRLTPVINQGNFIERAIANVARSLLYGGSLAVLVLLFFLHDLRSTLVISFAIPISVVATFALLILRRLHPKPKVISPISQLRRRARRMSHPRAHTPLGNSTRREPMPINKIQFQPGLSLPDFLAQFGTEAQCETALEKTR
jgi:hypothetical protein